MFGFVFCEVNDVMMNIECLFGLFDVCGKLGEDGDVFGV